MRTSISHLKSHLECPRKAHNLNVALRGLGRSAKALELGTWLHELLAAKMRGTSSPFIEVPQDRFPPGEWLNEATRIAYLAQEWEMPKEWEVMEVEKEMSLAVGRHEVVGRLDGVVRWNGMFWHCQHKSLARNTSLAAYSDLMRYDFHECVYQRMAEVAGYQPFAGTILNVFKKGVPKGENPYFVDYLNREEEIVNSILKDVECVMDQIEAQYMFEKESNERLVEIGMLNLAYAPSGGYNDRIIGNRSACMGPFRNSPCAFLPCCNRQTTLGDNAIYVDLEARYGNKTKEDQSSAP